MRIISIAGITAFFLCSHTVAATENYQYRVAFMPDIHFHDVYGEFQDGAFK